MNQLYKQVLVILGLLLFMSSQSMGQSKWVPIMLGDITTFVPNTPSVQTTKKYYTPNATVTVNVQGYLSADRDWVGIYRKNDDNRWGNVINWAWVEKNGRVALTESDGLMPVGEYEVRLFFHNAYGAGVVEKAKSGFKVSLDGGNKKYPKPSILKKSPITELAVVPTKNNPIVYDTKLGTKTRFIVKNDTPSDSHRSSYPKMQAWNKDMSLVRIGYRLYDTKDYKESPITKPLNDTSAYHKLCSSTSGYLLWSSIKENKFYVINSENEFVEATIQGNNVNCKHVLDSFDDYQFIHMGPFEGNIDTHDKYVVFVGKKKNDTTIYIILYDIQNQKRVWKEDKVLPESDDDEWIIREKQWMPKRMDWISVSPSGKHIVVNNGYINDAKNGMYVYDMEFKNKTKLYYKYHGDNKVYPVKGGHGDMGYDQEGNEVWVQFVSGVGVYMFNINKPNTLGQELLGSPYGDGHITCRNIKRNGYCYMTTRQNKYAYAFALKLVPDIDGTNGKAREIVELFSQTYMANLDKPYDTTYYPFGGVSPDGTKMIFNEYLGVGHYANGNEYDKYNTFVAEVK